MNFISVVDGQSIEVNADPTKKYGIFLSGGIDSAILLAALVKDSVIKGFTLDIQPFTIPAQSGASPAPHKVIDYINQHFDVSIPPTIFVGDITQHHSKLTKYAFGQVIQLHPEIDMIFMGLNQNPPPPFVSKAGLFPNRAKESNHVKLELPFIKLYKNHVIDIMFQLGVEKLSELTHSCTEQSKRRCNSCFACDERQWAFDTIGRTDSSLSK
jgi:hypothetical protein